MKDIENDKKDDNKEINAENEKVIQIKPSSGIIDTLVVIIIDKIISDAVINSKINDIYKTINNHCFSYLTNSINPYLKSRFIFYENGIEDLNQQKNELYFCNKPIDKINTWNIITEPKCNEVDRCANTKAKLVKYKKYTDLKDDGLKESCEIRHIKTNAFDDNEEKANNINTKAREANKYYVKNSKKNVSKNINNEKNMNIKKEVKIKSIKQIYQYNDEKSPRKKEKEEILELSTINDLPVESYENKYSLINSNEENEKLRKEKEYEILKREENKKIEKEKKDQKSRQLLMKRLEREFDSNRLTFDPNGKVINLKYQNYDNLEGGFVFSKLKIKTESMKKKSTLNLMDIVYPIEGVEANPISEIKNENLANKKGSSIKGKENLINRIESDISKIIVEKNEEDKLLNNDKNRNNKAKEKKETIVPSGSNFEKIIPEVGVVITGENRNEVKEGGFDYVKKYNRPSFNDLSRFISESINLNSHNFSSLMNSNNSNNDLNKKNQNINNYSKNEYIKTEGNNYIGYKEDFNENNPLIKNAHYLNNNIKYYSPSSKKYSNLSINNENLNSRRRNLLNSYDRIKTDNNNYQSIQISNNLEANNKNLKNIFDDAINISANNRYVKSLEFDNLQNMNYLERAILPFKNLRYKKENGIRKLVDLSQDNNKEKQYSDQILIN